MDISKVGAENGRPFVLPNIRSTCNDGPPVDSYCNLFGEYVYHSFGPNKNVSDAVFWFDIFDAMEAIEIDIIFLMQQVSLTKDDTDELKAYFNQGTDDDFKTYAYAWFQQHEIDGFYFRINTEEPIVPYRSVRLPNSTVK